MSESLLNARCPLCYKPLDEGHAIETNLAGHYSEPIPCSLRNLLALLDDEADFDDLQEGIFVRHLGCESKSPFWDQESKKSDYGDNYDEMSPEATIPGEGKEVRHWQVSMLKRIGSENDEMWFPAAMLRATTGDAESLRTSRGRTVALAGPRGVGKTIIAVQAMHYFGYVGPKTNGEDHVHIDHYVYSRKPTDFAHTVHMVNLLRRPTLELMRAVPDPSDKTLGDVKAVFFRAPTVNTLRSGINIFSGIFSGRRSIRPAKRLPLLFYDLAGELAEIEGDQRLKTVRDAADSTAVLVDARSLFPYDGNDPVEAERMGGSLSVACEQINYLSSKPGKRWCIVLTKLDDVRKRLHPECGVQWGEVESLAVSPDWRNGKSEHTSVTLARETLLKIAAKSNSAFKVPFLNCLRAPNVKPPVFFVWTDGLPLGLTGHEDSPISQIATVVPEPRYSYGLAKFVSWCLETDWAALNHGTRGS
jgi:hypothetical protein